MVLTSPLQLSQLQWSAITGHSLSGTNSLSDVMFSTERNQNSRSVHENLPACREGSGGTCWMWEHCPFPPVREGTKGTPFPKHLEGRRISFTFLKTV